MSKDDRKDGISYMEYIRGSQELIDNINAQIGEHLSSSSWGKADAGQLFLVHTLQQQQEILFSQLWADLRIYYRELDEEAKRLFSAEQDLKEQLKSRFLIAPFVNDVSECDAFNKSTKHLVDKIFDTEEEQTENDRKRSELVVFINEQKKKMDEKIGKRPNDRRL